MRWHARVLMLICAALLCVESRGVAEEMHRDVPVIREAYRGDEAAVQELERLLAAGASPNTSLRGNYTALMAAARRGNTQAIRVLLAAGADARAEERGSQDTALHYLARARMGYCPICAGHTPAQAEEVAAAYGRQLVQAADMLLAAGADINAQNRRGNTPFAEALGGNRLLLEYMLQQGAELPVEGSEAYCKLLECIVHGGACSLPVLVRAGLNTESCLADGSSLLMSAAANAKPGVMQELLAAGAAVNAATPKGRTALFAAMSSRVMGAQPEVRLQMVRMLLAAGADALHMMNGCNAFHTAAAAGWADVLQVLAEKCPAGVNMPSAAGLTPLHIAAKVSDLQTVRVLLAAGADVHARDANNRSVLAAAAGSSVEDEGDRLQVLIDAGADVQKDGADALIAACQTGRAKAVRRLLAAGVSAKSRVESSGNTMLHLATWNRHAGVVEALIAAGAEVNAANSVGNTPLHFAVQYGHPRVWQVVCALVDAGGDVHRCNHYGKTPLEWAAPGIRHKLQQKLGIEAAAGAETPKS